MDNGVNDTTNNQSIPGVKVAMPSDKPVDASTTDVGAAVSNAQQINAQPVIVTTQPVQAALTVAPAVPQPTPTITQTAPVVMPVGQITPVTTASTVSPQTAAQPIAAVTTTELSQTATTGQTDAVIDSASKKRNEKRPVNKMTFLLIIIVILIAACGGLWFYHQQQMNIMRIKCTPVSTSGETKELDLDSTIVKDLYGKVSTNIREDLGAVELTDEMKLYLAYRQIANSDMYDSNCNKFSATSMEPFLCELSATFVPKAFKADVLQVELKKLFGEETNISNQNIQLGNTCIGGFQYIEERGEYVQGQCGSTGATLYRVEKELINATSTESTIVLTERVKYYGAESLDLPTRLVSGTYKYTFKLDMNYNYVYVSKELAS